MALIVAALVLADLAPGLWHAPSATAQSAAPYHWARKRSHFRLRVGNNVAGDWNRYVREAISEWNQNDTATFIEVDGATNPQYCQPVVGTVQVCDWWYGTQTGWLGLTRLYFNASGDHIDAATVMLNNSFMYAPRSPYNSDAARRHTICHELGHTLGLDHVGTTSCTNDSQYAVFTYVSPINDDFRQLRRIYEHTDATRTVARQEAELDLFAPASQSADPSGLESDEEVMALPLDEETQVLTFVIWANEETLAEIVATSETDPGLTGALEPDAITADTDGDGVADADELHLYQTNPTLADTDGDNIVDGEELFGSHTDPLLWDDVGPATSLLGPDGTTAVSAGAPADVIETDLDADNFADALEWNLGLDPGNPDTDGDGVADGDELNLYHTEPTIPDTDGDGFSDGEELFAAGTDPLTP
jgi:predicted Zn-dependent protease